MTLLDDLRAVRALIDTPEKWTKGRFVRMPTSGWAIGAGGIAPVTGGPPVAYCIVGAIDHVCGALGERRMAPLMTLVRRLRWTGNLVEWQDLPSRTHAEVLALLDAAIAEAEGTLT